MQLIPAPEAENTKMVLRLVFLAYGICVLFVPTALAGSLDQQSSKEAELKARLLLRLLEAEKQNMAVPEETVGTQNELQEERGEEKETVHKVEDKGNIIDITVGDQLIEQHVQDCQQRYEMIVLNDDGTNVRQRACYLHKMEDKLYDFACQGKGERPYQTYYIGKEVVNKDFVSEDGPVSMCRDRPMFYIMPANDLDQDSNTMFASYDADDIIMGPIKGGQPCRIRHRFVDSKKVRDVQSDAAKECGEDVPTFAFVETYKLTTGLTLYANNNKA